MNGANFPSTRHGRPTASTRGVPPSGRNDGGGTWVHRATRVRDGANRAEWRPDREWRPLGPSASVISAPRVSFFTSLCALLFS